MAQAPAGHKFPRVCRASHKFLIRAIVPTLSSACSQKGTSLLQL